MVGCYNLMGSSLNEATIYSQVILLKIFRYYTLLFLLILYPYQNTLNMLVGFSLKPIWLGLPFLLFIDVIFRRVAAGRKFGIFVERYGLLYLVVGLIFLPLALIVSFIGAVQGFLVQYLGIFSFFVFKDLRVDERRKKIMIVAIFSSLFVTVVYGIYEYFFARFALVDWLIAHSSNSFVNGSIPVENSFKRVTAGVFYRSQSFELAFLEFGYQGFLLSTLSLGILFLWSDLRKKVWMAIATLLSFIGMLSSLTFSAVGMFIAGFFYFIFGLRGFKRLRRVILLSLLMFFFAVALLFTIPQFRDTVGLALEFNSAGSKLAVHTDAGSLFESSHVLSYLIIGRGTATASTSQRWFPVEWFVENQYVATVVETGIIGLAVYILFMISIYLHLRRIKKRFQYGSFDYALVVSLIWVWVFYVAVGFIHGAWGSDVDFMFMGLVGLISNKYATYNNLSALTTARNGNISTTQTSS